MKRKREGKETETAAGTSGSCDDGSGRGYEVFLSFRGPDARLTIADCLYSDLIRAFKDDEELRFGEEIEGGLLQAINGSRIYIPIFSKDYASSKWCLRELARIVELSRDNDEKVILPIFYDVDADDVKLKTKLYHKALRKHKSDSGKDLVKKWKKALREVVGIKGRNLKDHGLHKLINLTVKEVSNLLWTRRTNVPDHLVGIKDRMDHIMKLLDLGAFDVPYIVIHGMGSIGKTTLAKAVFSQISPKFQDHCCFLKDVRTQDILNLRKKLFFDVLKLSFTELSFIDEKADMIKRRFCGKKVLIVLDDIDKRDQITRLVGEPNWYGGGSRIIITTRNVEFQAEDGNVATLDNRHFSFYPMPEMDQDDALQLFCERALGCAKPPPDYMDIADKLINALGRLPLALDVIGSTLRGKGRITWEDTLCKLKKVMNEDVKKKLMITYKALEPNQQQIYLDIACFFINTGKTTAVKYWDAVFGYPTGIEVNILKRMSLIKISDDDTLWMHDQLRDLGKNIVHPESREIHLRGSRLWSPKDALSVVHREMGTKDMVALNLGTPEPNKYRFKPKQFVGLVKLRFLKLDHGNFKGDFKDVFFELRWLSWSNCPSKFRATNFGLKNLAVLELAGVNITEEWGGWCEIMVAKQLKVLQLVNCPSLRKTPEFSLILGLERVILRGCTGLTEIGESIGNLQYLDYLEIDCEAIESLPESIDGLKSLTVIRLKSDTLSMLPHSIGSLVKVKHLTLRCPKLLGLPDSIGQLESLLELDVQPSKISKLPRSIGNLGRLEVLRIKQSKLEKLPNSIGRLQSLLELNLFFAEIRSLPDCIGDVKKLKILELSGNCINELPKTIGKLENLEVLRADCEHMKREIPSEIGELPSLKILSLINGSFRLPTTIDRLTNLEEFDLGFCGSNGQLPELPKSLTSLSFSWNSMTTTPDFSNLTNLVDLRLWGTPKQEPNTEGIVRLRALRYLNLSVGEMTLPPTDLSSLSQLQWLRVGCADLRSLTRLPSSLQQLVLKGVQSPIDWSLFSNLENLSSLEIEGYSPGEIRFEVLEKLQKFKRLVMFDCPLLKTLPVLPGLKEIQTLFLCGSPQLTEIQGLGELRSLRDLNISSCHSVKSLNKSDMSNLQNLERLEFNRCESLESELGVPESCQLIVKDCPRFNKDG